jgi:hypothetical protein
LINIKEGLTEVIEFMEKKHHITFEDNIMIQKKLLAVLKEADNLVVDVCRRIVKEIT